MLSADNNEGDRRFSSVDDGAQKRGSRKELSPSHSHGTSNRAVHRDIVESFMTMAEDDGQSNVFCSSNAGSLDAETLAALAKGVAGHSMDLRILSTIEVKKISLTTVVIFLTPGLLVGPFCGQNGFKGFFGGTDRSEYLSSSQRGEFLLLLLISTTLFLKTTLMRN